MGYEGPAQLSSSKVWLSVCLTVPPRVGSALLVAATSVSGAAQPFAYALSPAPTRSLELNLFLSLSNSILVMSARKRKERTSDPQNFDSIQGSHPRVILSVCHNLSFFSFFLLPQSCEQPQLRKDLVLRIKTKLNHRADSQGAYLPLVTELHELSTLSERLLILRSNSSETLLDHCQADILDREGLSHLFRRPLTSLPYTPHLARIGTYLWNHSSSMRLLAGDQIPAVVAACTCPTTSTGHILFCRYPSPLCTSPLYPSTTRRFPPYRSRFTREPRCRLSAFPFDVLWLGN